MISDTWRVGGLLSYARTLVVGSGENTGRSTHVKSYGLMGYTGYATDRWYLDITAGAVQQQSNTVRDINFTGFSGDAFGQFKGMQYVASIQGGYPIKLDSLMPDTTLTPIAGLISSTLRQDAYTESGGNGAALKIGATHSTSLKSELGSKVKRSFKTKYGDIVPSVQLTWRHEYHHNGVQSVANFAADTSGATSFTIRGAAPVIDTGVLALGVTVIRSKNLALEAGYTVEGTSGYTAKTVDLRFRYQF